MRQGQFIGAWIERRKPKGRRRRKLMEQPKKGRAGLSKSCRRRETSGSAEGIKAERK